MLARGAAFYDIHADEADVIGKILTAGEFLRFVDQFVEQQLAGQIHVLTDGFQQPLAAIKFARGIFGLEQTIGEQDDGVLLAEGGFEGWITSVPDHAEQWFAVAIGYGRRGPPTWHGWLEHPRQVAKARQFSKR